MAKMGITRSEFKQGTRQLIKHLLAQARKWQDCADEASELAKRWAGYKRGPDYHTGYGDWYRTYHPPTKAELEKAAELQAEAQHCQSEADALLQQAEKIKRDSQQLLKTGKFDPEPPGPINQFFSCASAKLEGLLCRLLTGHAPGGKRI